jgi:hypothetical protein
MISKIITIHDKQYKIEPEQESYSCQGCVFKAGFLDEECNVANGVLDKLCVTSRCIFTEVQTQPASEEEQKYTLKELIDKIGNLGYSTAGLDCLVNLKELKQDPEYKKFIELKEKFKL